MAHHQNPKLEADSQQDKPILIPGTLRVEKPDGIFIEKHGLRFFKGNPVLSDVFPAFPFVPLKSEIIHMYSVHIQQNGVNAFLTLLLCYAPSCQSAPDPIRSWKMKNIRYFKEQVLRKNTTDRPDLKTLEIQ